MRIVDKIKNNKFWSSVMQLSFGQVVGQAINLICVPILSRVYSTNDYGQLGILVSTATIITGFVCLGINSSMMLAETDEDARTAFHVSHNLQIFLAAVVVAALFLISGFRAVINTDIPIAYALLLIFVYISFNARNTLLAIYLNRMGLNKVLLLSPIINACANLLIALPLGLLKLKFYGLIASAIMAFFVSNIVMSHYAKLGFKHCSFREYKEVLKTYSDLVKFQYPSNLVTSLSTQTPNQILSSQFGNDSLGSYSMCDKVFHIPFTMIATPIQTIYFRTASKMSDRMDMLSDFTYSMVSKMLYVAAVPVLIVVFFGKEIFSFVLGSDWAQAGEWASFLILMYVFAFVNNCITYCRVSIGKAKINLFTSIGNLAIVLVSIVIGAFLVKSLQTTIIAFSIASTVFGAVNIYITFRCMGKNHNRFLLLAALYIAAGALANVVKWGLL